MSDDGTFRVITADTTAAVRGALDAQARTGALSGAGARVASTLSDLITATILLRETMAPDLRVQGILQGSGQKGRMVADSHPDGSTRGLVMLSKGASDLPLAAGHLQMMRTLYNGKTQQGIVEIPSAGGVSGALMEYLQSSEQIVATAVVASHFEGGELKAAGGYIVQLLPEASDKAPLAVMAERLADFQPLDTLLAEGKASPRLLLEELLYAMPYTVVGEGQVHFSCGCSQARVAMSLASLPRKDIEEFIAEGKRLDIMCDYCGQEYEVSPEQLRGLASSN
jgi:molecular chaperone Hsp33